MPVEARLLLGTYGSILASLREEAGVTVTDRIEVFSRQRKDRSTRDWSYKIGSDSGDVVSRGHINTSKRAFAIRRAIERYPKLPVMIGGKRLSDAVIDRIKSSMP
jgi:hypothetical protein